MAQHLGGLSRDGGALEEIRVLGAPEARGVRFVLAGQGDGLAVADEDTMSQAIHDVYCGIMADHEHPNDKDREQARAMMAALQKHATAGAEA